MPRNLVQETEFIVDKLEGNSGIDFGGVLPKKLKGSSSVNIVKGLRLIRTQSYSAGTQFTLAWIDPDYNENLVSHFNIYIIGLLNDNRQFLGPFSVSSSPAEIRVQADKARPVKLVVQTVLRNGQASAIDLSPSVTGNTIAPYLLEDDFLDDTVPQDAIIDVEDFVKDGQNLVTVGKLVLVSAAGEIDEVEVYNIDDGDSPYDIPDDANVVFVDASSGAVVINLPAVSSRPARVLEIRRVDINEANSVTIDCNGADTIEGEADALLPTSSAFTLSNDASSAWYII